MAQENSKQASRSHFSAQARKWFQRSRNKLPGEILCATRGSHQPTVSKTYRYMHYSMSSVFTSLDDFKWVVAIGSHLDVYIANAHVRQTLGQGAGKCKGKGKGKGNGKGKCQGNGKGKG